MTQRAGAEDTSQHRQQLHLTFFSEVESDVLQSCLNSTEVLADLVMLGARVSLGLPDFSPERAAFVQRLNHAGIPLVAWIILPRGEGYFLNLGNGTNAMSRYEEFQHWTAQHKLEWDAIGLDVAPDWRVRQAFARNPWSTVLALVLRAWSGKYLFEGLAAAQALLSRIHRDGYPVELYQLPFILDERRAGTTLLQRLSGVIDLLADREVVLLYSSLMIPRGPIVLYAYGRDAQAIAVGSTGGGLDTRPKLTWDELRRDLLLARRWTDEVYVFSLEGCVERGFLPRLGRLDWNQKVALPLVGNSVALLLRAGLRCMLRAMSHPLITVGLLAFLEVLRHRIAR